MNQTLDQQRAAFAWDAVIRARRDVPKFDDFKNLAKGAPAMIMGNGLMSAIAFYASRKKKDVIVPHAASLRDTILAWLVTRFKNETAFQPLPRDFKAMMERLQGLDSRLYMQATEETLAMLRWVRQFADAIAEDGGRQP